MASSRSVVPFLCAALASRGLVVTDFRRERGDQHQRLLHQYSDPRRVGANAGDAAIGEGIRSIGQEPDRLEHGIDDDRLKHVELEMTLARGDCRTRGSTPMVSASTWIGLTLPGMIEEPGSFSGRINSPSPERGLEPMKRRFLPSSARCRLSVYFHFFRNRSSRTTSPPPSGLSSPPLGGSVTPEGTAGSDFLPAALFPGGRAAGFCALLSSRAGAALAASLAASPRSPAAVSIASN